MKQPFFRGAAFLLVAVLAAACSGCGEGQNSAQSSQSSGKASSIFQMPLSSVPDTVPSQTSQDGSVSQESSQAVSLPEVSQQVSSQPEVSQQVSSQPEVSQQASSQPEVSQQEASQPDPSQAEKQALQEYADKMAKKGEIPLPKMTSESVSGSWKVNHYSISDFNGDGSQELVIQYDCGIELSWDSAMKRSNDHQGIVLRIVKYQDGAYREYQNAEFDQYIRFAGADIGTESEITEELFVDNDGNLGILRSTVRTSDSVSLLYDMKVIKNGTLTDAGGLSLTQVGMSGRYGGNRTFDAPYWFMISIDNTFDRAFLFRDYHGNLGEDSAYIDLQETRKRFAAIQELKKCSEFTIFGSSYPIEMQEVFAGVLASDFYIGEWNM